MKLWLVRHGATQATLEGRYAGHGDLPLAREGIEQAKALARIVPRDVDVWSSDLLRARQTAEVIATRPVRTSPDFRELSFGRFDGLTPAECSARWPEAYHAFVSSPWQSAPVDGEELSRLSNRVARGLAVIRAETTGDAILVTHAGPIKVLLLHALGLTLSAVHVFHVDPGSASLLELWDGGATLRMLNAGSLP